MIRFSQAKSASIRQPIIPVSTLPFLVLRPDSSRRRRSIPSVTDMCQRLNVNTRPNVSRFAQEYEMAAEAPQQTALHAAACTADTPGRTMYRSLAPAWGPQSQRPWSGCLATCFPGMFVR